MTPEEALYKLAPTNRNKYFYIGSVYNVSKILSLNFQCIFKKKSITVFINFIKLDESYSDNSHHSRKDISHENHKYFPTNE